MRWVPRERNRFSDALANFALDRYNSFFWGADYNWDTKQRNYVIMSDGACRGRSQAAAFGWAIFGFERWRVTLCAAGGRSLPPGTDSFCAEIHGLVAGVQAFTQFVKGYGHAARDAYERTLEFCELPEKIFDCLQL